jgi:hypothetical protein
MRVCYFDAFSGIAGDMTVGALADAGADPPALLAGLETLGTGAVFGFEKVKRHGIAATRFLVEGGEQKAHRHLPQILAILGRSRLSDTARRNASAVFERLAGAEAAVHGVPMEKVHFHEVGAVDSIADIAGACLALDLLGVEKVYCSPVNTGSGTVSTEHGVLPVPAPATAALLKGRPIYAAGPARELTTPTGAALASALACDFGPPPPMLLEKAGYGAGSYDFPEQANVLRVLIGEASGASEAVEVTIIEANLDDCSPEVLGYALERLMAAGALDVSFTPAYMKKNRPGTLVRVIARPEDREPLAGLLMAETSTLGLRLWSAERRVQERRTVEVETAYGSVRVKVSDSGGFAPEYEDCRKLAESSGTPLKTILAQASHAYLKSSSS